MIPKCDHIKPDCPPFLVKGQAIFSHFSAFGFPRGHSGKEYGCQCRRCKRCRFNPWIGKIPGNGNPPQYSCLENSIDRGAWWATVHGVTKSQTPLNTHVQTHTHTHTHTQV